MAQSTLIRRPPWLKVKLTGNSESQKIRRLLKSQKLHTVCESARCPNIGECWSQRTATFMILGDVCTRNCAFCAIGHGEPEVIDADEPRRVAEVVRELGLSYAVVTSVTRDDLPDGGAEQFAATIRAIRMLNPSTKVEVLIPDFAGSSSALDVVIDAKPDVLNHNIETVAELYPIIRPQAIYQRSLRVLRRAAEANLLTKSGFMLGLGETIAQVHHTLRDLLEAGCQIVTIGQYLSPSHRHLPVKRFVSPEEFQKLKEFALKMGFRHVESAPLVRSSYHAQQQTQMGMLADGAI